jgi:fatty-acyl-CoA synthase
VAFRQDGRDLSYVQTADLLARWVTMLRQRRFEPGQGIGVLSPNRPEVWLGQTAAPFAGGYIVDRKKDMIVSGGFNVFPREIEDVIASHPAVSAAAVIGVPDPKWGEAVKALVVAWPGADLDTGELIAMVRERKGPVYAPKSIELLDALPLTPVGKPDKKVLRARYWAGHERRVN